MDSLFRRIWRWHFWAGVLACPVLLIVAGTGALYTFKEELETWAQSELRIVPMGSTCRPLSEQLANAKSVYPTSTPTRIVLPGNPTRSTIVQVERPGAEAGTLPAIFINPYTAEVLGDGDVRSRFFSAVLKLHRSLFAGTTGRILVELTTSWTLVLLITGLYLWIPASWNRVRGVWLPRLSGSKYVVLRDLHTLTGLVLTPAIAIIAFTGLFFTVVWLWSFNGVTDGAGNFPREILLAPPSQKPGTAASPVSVDTIVAIARQRFPHQSLTLTLPKKPTDSFAVSARSSTGTTLDGSIAVDQFTGEILSEKNADQLPVVAQARLYVLPLHMGTIGGTPTKILALAACLVLTWLAVSGVWMWLTRRPEGRSGFPRASDARVPKLVVVLILLLAISLPTVGISLIVVLVGEWLLDQIGKRQRIRNLADRRQKVAQEVGS